MMYASGRQALIEGRAPWSRAHTAEALLMDGAYAPSESDDYASIVSRSVSRQPLIGRRSSRGVAYADDVKFPMVTAPTVSGVAIVLDGVPLLFVTGEPFPLKGDGADVLVEWNPSGIFGI